MFFCYVMGLGYGGVFEGILWSGEYQHKPDPCIFTQYPLELEPSRFKHSRIIACVGYLEYRTIYFLFFISLLLQVFCSDDIIYEMVVSLPS